MILKNTLTYTLDRHFVILALGSVIITNQVVMTYDIHLEQFPLVTMCCSPVLFIINTAWIL